MRFRCPFLVATVFLVACAARSQIADPVRLDAGLIAGAETTRSGVRVFRGIPFAAPPVGDLRWRPPQPVAPWSGVRTAERFGNICIQPPGRGRLNIAVLPESPPMSEDCLYLNVWTPATNANDALPVMVYFFGGAFNEGAGSIPLYDGTRLAEQGAVLVTMNYRLGPFGFFAHPALTADSGTNSSGNYGLADMLASLNWVQNNISAFGGDPENVTVFGQSAGATAISALTTAPRAEGLFHRAIAQSGAWLGLDMAAGVRTLESAEESGVAAAADAGVSAAEEMRAMSADDVVLHFRGAGMIVDSWVLPEDPSDTFAQGRQNEVDVLAGANKDESFFPSDPTVEEFIDLTRARWGDLADEYLSLYPHATDEEAAASSVQAYNDEVFWLSRRYAEYQRQLGQSAYLYLFAQNPPGGDGPDFSVAHAAEVPYVFDNLGQLPLFPDGSIPYFSGRSEPDLRVAEIVSSYWVNFARSGDPNGSGLPHWPAFGGQDNVDAAILDARPESESLPSNERMKIYDALYERMRSED